MNLTLPAIVAAAVLVGTTLTACSSSTCVDYTSYATPAAMAKDATIVVTGLRIGTTANATIYGQSADVHLVRIDSVLKGKATVGKTLTVVSLPVTCSTAPYPNGDQMNVAGEAEFFVRVTGKQVTTLTADAGVLKIPADGTLPWSP